MGHVGGGRQKNEWRSRKGKESEQKGKSRQRGGRRPQGTNLKAGMNSDQKGRINRQGRKVNERQNLDREKRGMRGTSLEVKE